MQVSRNRAPARPALYGPSRSICLLQTMKCSPFGLSGGGPLGSSATSISRLLAQAQEVLPRPAAKL